ncbi:MAG TPA: O-antigen ligase family protein [Vicinamibacteria bacterium]|nr:O-antigen ligase family protein [Vicinamibacteria bacterium]
MIPTGRAGVPPWLLAVSSLLLAAVLGAWVASHPAVMRLEVGPRGLLGLAAGLALAAIVLWRPDIGLVLLVAFVYLNLSQVLVRHHRLPSLLQLLAVPLLLGAWARRSRDDLRRVLTAPVTAFLALYLLVAFVSTALARDPALADRRVADVAKALAVFVLAALLASSVAATRRAVATMLAAGAVLGALAVLQVVTGGFAEEYGGLARIKYAQIYGDVFEPRIAGPLGDPNFFAQILVVLVPLALFLAKGEPGPRARALAFGAAFLVSTAAVLTYSRGGALTLACVLLLSAVVLRVPWRKAVLAALLVGIPVLAALPAGFARRLTTLEQITPGGDERVLRPDSSFQKRRLLVAAAWRMFLDHPVLGVGAGNYTALYEPYADEVGSAAREYEDPGEAQYPHSLYLEIAAETGILGLLPFGAALLAAFASLRRARAAFLAAGDEPAAWLTRGFEIALAGYLVSSLFLHGHFSRYLWLLLGLATALAYAAPPPGPAAADARVAANGAPP